MSDVGSLNGLDQHEAPQQIARDRVTLDPLHALRAGALDAQGDVMSTVVFSWSTQPARLKKLGRYFASKPGAPQKKRPLIPLSLGGLVTNHQLPTTNHVSLITYHASRIT